MVLVLSKPKMKLVKLIILMFAVAFLIHTVCSNEKILSQFIQHGYKLKDIRFQLMNYDKEFFNFFEIKVFKFNRTTAAHNFTVNYKVNAKDDIEILVQGYKFLSNEYRHFPMRFQTNLKKAFDFDALGFGDIRKCGNITDFYFYKDITYYACNFVTDEARFPPLMPNGRYRINFNMLYSNKKVALVSLFGEVYVPIAYPKK